MRYTYEAIFEPGHTDGVLVVEFPDLSPVVTQGYGVEDAIAEAADILEFWIVSEALDGNPLPKPTFGHVAENGFVKQITVEPRPASDVISHVSTTDAARILGVSTSRVRQLVIAKRLREKRRDEIFS